MAGNSTSQDFNAAANPDVEGLVAAVRAQNMEDVIFHLDSGADINGVSKSGYTALTIAAAYGYLDMIEMLIDRGADLDREGFSNMTPLMWAVYNAHADAVRCLLDRGADVNYIDEKFSTTALIRSSQKAIAGTEDVLRLLIERGADTEYRNPDGKTALDCATKAEFSGNVAVLSQASEIRAAYVREQEAAAKAASACSMRKSVSDRQKHLKRAAPRLSFKAGAGA